MGLTIDRSEFSDEEYQHAGRRLQDNLSALQMLFERPDFGRGESSLGAELEICLVDDQAQALPLNRQVLADSLDPNLTLELDRFNLEYNLSPVMSAGTPFANMRSELETALVDIRRIAAGHGGRIIPIGILPTLREEQLQSSAITDLARYHALQAGLQKIRKQDFEICIDGPEPIKLECNNVALEGANTSLQIHLRVNPDEFAAYYNAAQLATPLALAISANSPFFLGHSLWDETRIALFKQSVDTRGSHPDQWRRAARVPFGHGWTREGAFELFAESCYLYPIILPVCGDEEMLDIARSGGIPELLELRLHQGTIWNWNRAVYDAGAGGHVRIEFRALPAGPTPIDMMANAAFLVGLTVGLSQSIDSLLSAFPFRYAEYNFYRAAQHGLNAELLWPTLNGDSPRTAHASALCTELLETADRGLETIGVIDSERQQLLGVIRERLRRGLTPALWQRRMLERLSPAPREEALQRIVEDYIELSNSGLPVSEWP